MFHSCYGNGYGCGMFHNCYEMVMVVVCCTVVMEWLHLLWNGCGRDMFHGCNDMVVVCSTRCMLHQGWLTRGVVAIAPSLLTQLSGVPCGNALTSLCSLNLLIRLNPSLRRYGFFGGSSSWRMVGSHLHMFASSRCALSLGSEFLLIRS